MSFFLALLFLKNIPNVSAQNNNTFFLGHSLINFDVPNMVDQFSIASSNPFSYDANIGNGATLSWHWNNPTTGQGDQWDLTLPLGGYENFILTEAVPLLNHLQSSDTYGYTDNFCSFANQYNPNIQYYLYETWHCTNSGNGSTSGSGGYPCDWDTESNTPWRNRIDIDLEKWESIADSINLTHPNPMLIIPAGQALGRLADSIDNGEVPGLSSVFDLFVDEYHLDNRGNYFIACVVYTVIHGASPVGLPNQLTDPYGNLYTVYPTPEQAAIMQEIARQTVCDYQRDGVECAALGISSVENENSNIKIYPVPSNNKLFVQFANSFSENVSFSIYNQFGKEVLESVLSSDIASINLKNLSSGIYFLKIKNKVFKFIKS
ncbi:MAG: T9SS type A sorting domain-containing protein [Flavobacteriaceae bacterium]|nr:T9SS type A sorting domain-containing protein [Flavobacteriaceae bacterium]